MDAADIFNLYEAYRSVYEDQQSLTEEVDVELDEANKYEQKLGGKGLESILRRGDRNRRFSGDEPDLKRDDEVMRKNPSYVAGYRRGGQGPGSELRFHPRIKAHKERRGVKTRGTGVREDLDIYDLVLDHLLDEGFCDDVESAEVVMANMSEEWLDEILDEETKGETHMFKGEKGLSPEERKGVLRFTRKQARKNEDNRTARQKILGVKLSAMRYRNERRGYYDEPNETPRGSGRGAESPTDR
jgi:hypothetical protein